MCPGRGPVGDPVMDEERDAWIPDQVDGLFRGGVGGHDDGGVRGEGRGR